MNAILQEMKSMKIKKIFCITITLLFIVSCGSNGSNTHSNLDSQNDSSNITQDQWGEDHFFQPRQPNSRSEIEISTNEEFIFYTVKKHDTLMLISQSIYGDYSRWREIMNNNPSRARHLFVGDILKLVKPDQKDIENSPKGLPYIIQKGDTLASISDDKYGTPKKWVKIYKNNITLIKDPNRIFTGFTIFYEPEPQLSYNL